MDALGVVLPLLSMTAIASPALFFFFLAPPRIDCAVRLPRIVRPAVPTSLRFPTSVEMRRGGCC